MSIFKLNKVAETSNRARYRSNTRVNYNQETFTDESLLKMPVVYRCIEFLTGNVANLPLLPYKESLEGRVVDTDSPLYSLLKVAPNKDMSAYTFKRMILYSILTKGNAYVLVKRDVNGTVKELDYLDPKRVKVYAEYDQTGNVAYSVDHYEVDGKKYVSPDDMLHFINYSDDGIFGKSTLSMIADSLWLSKHQQKANIELYASNLVQPGYLSASVPIGTMEQRDQIREAWSRDGIKVLDRGIEYHAMQTSPQQAQMIENAKYNDELILAAFGLKLSNLFNISGPYGSVEQNQIDFLNNTLNPILQKIENEFERKLGINVNFDVNQILRSDRTALANMVSTMIDHKAITPSEGRNLLGFDKNDNISDKPINAFEKTQNYGDEQN